MAVVNFSNNNTSSTPDCDRYQVKRSEISRDLIKISKFKDQYILGRKLGVGQFGIIRECCNKMTGEVFACKSIAKEKLVSVNDVENVKLEIEIMTKLSGHPNVVDLKAVHEEEDCVHLVMELCAGGDLFHQLQKHGKLSEFDAAFILRNLVEVVRHCHKNGIVHRDLKPENILLATNTTSSQIKLADFGLATFIKPGQCLHGTVGSPFYIAPEVLSGGYDEAADVWSMGVILYILLSGLPPFWGKTKSQIFDAVMADNLCFPPDPWDLISESAKNLIRGMLQKNTYQRLTAWQVLEHPWIAGDPSTPLPCSTVGARDEKVKAVIAREEDISFGVTKTSVSPSCPSATELSPPSIRFFGSTVFSFNVQVKTSHSESQSPVLNSMPSFSFFPLSDREGGREENNGDFERKIGRQMKSQGIQGMRNHTISLGEINQLNIMVSESIIRWASCTRLPTAAPSHFISCILET